MLRDRIVSALSSLNLYGMKGVMDEVLAAGVATLAKPAAFESKFA
jgi:hypothetical protein